MKWYKIWNNNKNVDAIETVSKLRVVEWLRECHEWMKQNVKVMNDDVTEMKECMLGEKRLIVACQFEIAMYILYMKGQVLCG